MEELDLEEYLKAKGLSPEQVEAQLNSLLRECLSSMNQDGSYSAKLDVGREKFIVEFNVVNVPEDDYVGFTGY